MFTPYQRTRSGIQQPKSRVMSHTEERRGGEVTVPRGLSSYTVQPNTGRLPAISRHHLERAMRSLCGDPSLALDGNTGPITI